MTKLVFASQNPNKIREIREKVKDINIIGLDPALFKEELKEEGETLEANAIQKVQQVFEVLGEHCFADDTGLEIEALNQEPGVLSARYAGEDRSSIANMKKVLMKLEGVTNRSARFRTVIALIWNEKLYLFEGICEGEISIKPAGDMGFGYDPIFIPEGFKKSFAEMQPEEKNKISHRAIAVEKLATFLKSRS